jgi:signal transduction histidine kinase
MKENKILPVLLRNSIAMLCIVFVTFVAIVAYLSLTFRNYEKVTDHLHNFADLGQIAITHVIKLDHLNPDVVNEEKQELVKFDRHVLELFTLAKDDFLKVYTTVEFKKIKKVILLLGDISSLINQSDRKFKNAIEQIEEIYYTILKIKHNHISEKNFQVRNNIIFSFIFLLVTMITVYFRLSFKIRTIITPIKELVDIAGKLSITKNKIEIDNKYKYVEYRLLASALRDMHQRMTYESRVSSQESTTSFLSDYSENLSHSINNPLAIIATTVKILKRQALKNDDTKMIFEMDIMLNEVDRVSKITSMMKSLIHTSSKLSAARFEARNIGSSINLLFFNKFFDKSIKFTQSIDEKMIIYCIEAIVIHVVVSLVDNAIKYIDSVDPEISLVITSVDHGISISVRDNGAAPPEAEIYKCLLGDSKVSNLGLFSSRRLAEENGYRLFYNESPVKEFVLEINYNDDDKYKP